MTPALSSVVVDVLGERTTEGLLMSPPTLRPPVNDIGDANASADAIMVPRQNRNVWHFMLRRGGVDMVLSVLILSYLFAGGDATSATLPVITA